MIDDSFSNMRNYRFFCLKGIRSIVMKKMMAWYTCSPKESFIEVVMYQGTDLN